MKTRGGGHASSGVFVFLLLGVFAVFSTLLVLFCAQAYRNTVDQTAYHGEERVLQTFVRNTLRAEDAQGAVSAANVGGVNALLLTVGEGEDRYVRYIYCYNGSLCDLLLFEDDEFDPALGEEICPAQQFSVEVGDRLITVRIVDAAGEERSFFIARRSVL